MANKPIAHRVRACKNCGSSFTYLVRRGADRLFCSEACGRRTHLAKYKARTMPSCGVEGCDKPAANLTCGMCDAHYARLRRNGHIGLAPPPPRIIDHSHGYKLVYAPHHPLGTSGQQSRIYEHRAVFYDAHGAGPFRCYHCAERVTWGDMHVDHLNDCKDDNRIENLVASCPLCNQARGRDKMRRSHHARAKKWTLNGVTRTTDEWAKVLGIGGTSVAARIKAGWPLERALTEGRGKTGPKRKGA